MGKIFRRREYGSLDKLLDAVESWIVNTDDYKEAYDFLIVVHKSDEHHKRYDMIWYDKTNIYINRLRNI